MSEILKDRSADASLGSAIQLLAELDDAIHRLTVTVDSFGEEKISDFLNAKANLENRVYAVERQAEAVSIAIYELQAKAEPERSTSSSISQSGEEK